MDSGEKICKKIDFWIAKAVKKLKKLKKYVILYLKEYALRYYMYTWYILTYITLRYRESEDKMLALKETFQAISKVKKVTQLEMAEVLGISKQNFSNKLKRNTFSPDELAKIAEMLNMELAFIDKGAVVENGEKFILEGSTEV